jgi:hypothetical protein
MQAVLANIKAAISEFRTRIVIGFPYTPLQRESMLTHTLQQVMLMGTLSMEGRWSWTRHVALAVALATACLHAAPAAAAIPASEREALIAIYEATHGGTWVANTNWCATSPCPLEAPTFSPPGSECFSGTPGSGWYGVMCNGDRTHVAGINLSANHLTGTLPSIAAFTALQGFLVSNNELSGTLPDISALTELRTFAASANHFTGSIPSLAGFSALEAYLVGDNQLTGTLPSLDGLDALMSFDAGSNELTGPIPELTGRVALVNFVVTGNALTGSIPDLSGLDELTYFFAERNRLEGSIPPLETLTQLQQFFVSGNLLTGTIPALPPGLLRIDVGNNHLSGAVPEAPSTLWEDLSRLCPNPLDLTPGGNDAGWNAATGHAPWWSDPAAGGSCDNLFGTGFEIP